MNNKEKMPGQLDIFKDQPTRPEQIIEKDSEGIDREGVIKKYHLYAVLGGDYKSLYLDSVKKEWRVNYKQKDMSAHEAYLEKQNDERKADKEDNSGGRRY